MPPDPRKLFQLRLTPETLRAVRVAAASRGQSAQKWLEESVDACLRVQAGDDPVLRAVLKDGS